MKKRPHLFSFLLGIVLIIPWVYKIIIKYRSGGEYIAGGLHGIGGVFFELLAGIGLMGVLGALWGAHDRLIKHKSIQITLHYIKTGLLIMSFFIGVGFLIAGALLIKEDFEASAPFIFVSVPLIVIGCGLSVKTMLYLFAILIVTLPFFTPSLPNFSVFNFIFGAVLVWVAEGNKNQQDKLAEKVKAEG